MTDQPPMALIEDAANILCWRGYLDPEDDEIPAEVVAELTELAKEGPCAFCPAPLRPDALADHWVARKQEEYERSLPTWTCDCGAVFKLLSEWGNQQAFYEARDDGLLGDRVGFIRHDGKRRVKHSDACPDCGRSFAVTIARHADPQQALVLGRVATAEAINAACQADSDPTLPAPRPATISSAVGSPADPSGEQLSLFDGPGTPR